MNERNFGLCCGFINVPYTKRLSSAALQILIKTEHHKDE
jgi:hypothetical protein